MSYCEKKYIENYLLTEGKEIIFQILKEYFENTKTETKNVEIVTNTEKKEMNLEVAENEKNNEIFKSLDIASIVSIEKVRKIYNEVEKEDEDKEVTIKMKGIKKLLVKILDINKEIEEQKKNYVDEIGRIKGEKETLEKNISKLQSSCENLEKDIEILKNDEAKLKNRINEKNNEIKNLEKKLDTKRDENGNLEKKKTELEGDIKILNSNIEEKKKIILGLEKELEKKKESVKIIENEKREIKGKLSRLDEVSKLQELYDKYLGISEKYKKELEKLIRIEDVNSFISCCYTLATMEDLWEFVNRESREEIKSDIEVLKEIFEYFILQQNKKYEESTYKMLIPKVGDEFDPTKHININGRSSGKIEKIIFYGFGSMNSKSNPTQTDDEREFKKVRKLAIVSIR